MENTLVLLTVLLLLMIVNIESYGWGFPYYGGEYYEGYRPHGVEWYVNYNSINW